METFRVQPHEHPILAFRRWVEAIPEDAYPAELVPIGGRYIPGTVAFPGSYGLYVPPDAGSEIPPDFPYGGAMLVGHNVDKAANYAERYHDGTAHGEESRRRRRMPYWTTLRRHLLEPANIPLGQFFATNVHPALVSDGRSVVGRSDRNADWWALVEELLLAQIREMEPRVIAALGEVARRVVGDLAGMSLPDDHPSVVPATIGGIETQVVPMAHPSAWTGVKHRRYQGTMGRAADAAALRDAWASGGGR